MLLCNFLKVSLHFISPLSYSPDRTKNVTRNLHETLPSRSDVRNKKQLALREHNFLLMIISNRSAEILFHLMELPTYSLLRCVGDVDDHYLLLLGDNL